MTDFCKKGINLLTKLEINDKKITTSYKDQTVCELTTDNIVNCNVINSELVIEFNEDEF